MSDRARQVARILAVCGVLAGSALLRAQGAVALWSLRLPFRPPLVGLPLTPYSLQLGLAELAWAVQTPIGFEAVSDQSWQPGASPSTLETAGRTVSEILSDIIVREPRYGYTIDAGVIHVRPTASVADAANFLNQPIARFEIDRAALTQALREVRIALQPALRNQGSTGGGMGPSALGARPLTVRVEFTTVHGVLDAIVKAHGAASWSVTYRIENGRLTPLISFHTFDGWTVTG